MVFLLLATFAKAQTRTITGNAGWRMISIPVTGATVSDVSDDTAIQGITGGANSSEEANFYYNPGSDGTGTDGWLTPTNMSTAWGDGLGAILYFYDNTSQGSTELPITLDASGSEPPANVSVTLTDKFALVGNPFQSNINLDNISGNGVAVALETLLQGGLKSPVSVWNDNAETWSTFNVGEGNIVSTWQGFFLERDESATVASAATTLTIPTTAKTATAADVEIFSKAKATDWRRINLNLSTGSHKDNASKLYFKVGSHVGEDSFDGSKLGSLNGSPTIAFVQDFGEGEVLLSQDARAFELNEVQNYQLKIDDAGINGEYTLSWETMKHIPSDWSIILTDLKTEEQIDMQSVFSYSFEVEAVQEKQVSTTLLAPSVKAKKLSGTSSRFGITIAPNTSVSNEPDTKPTTFALNQNYPNPFNPSTTISYSVGQTGPVNITVYNVMGQKVAELVNATKTAGNNYQISWDATAQASGIYYYRLTAPGQVLTRQMTLIK